MISTADKKLNPLEITKSYLNELYRSFHGYDDHCDANTRAYAQKNIRTIYGEITPTGVHQLLDLLWDDFGPKSVFYDLGSGVGKVVAQVFLMTEVKRAVGIEGLPSRHEQALQVKNTMHLEVPEFFMKPARKLDFLCENFLNHDLKDATIIFTNPVCFGTELRTKLEIKMQTLKSLTTLISLMPMDRFENQNGWTFWRQLPVRTSWDSRATCYIYKKLVS
jgi:hypothetical protein